MAFRPAHRRKRDPYAKAILAPRIEPPAPPPHRDPPTPAWQVEPCRSCQKPVIWAVTINANPMPVDAEPAEGGNVQMEWRGPDMKPIAHVLPVAKQFGKRDLRTSHFATCPHADRWRTRARKAAP